MYIEDLSNRPFLSGPREVNREFLYHITPKISTIGSTGIHYSSVEWKVEAMSLSSRRRLNYLSFVKQGECWIHPSREGHETITPSHKVLIEYSRTDNKLIMTHIFGNKISSGVKVSQSEVWWYTIECWTKKIMDIFGLFPGIGIDYKIAGMSAY